MQRENRLPHPGKRRSKEALIPCPGQPLSEESHSHAGVRTGQQESGDQPVLGEEAKPLEDEVTSGT